MLYIIGTTIQSLFLPIETLIFSRRSRLSPRPARVTKQDQDLGTRSIHESIQTMICYPRGLSHSHSVTPSTRFVLTTVVSRRRSHPHLPLISRRISLNESCGEYKQGYGTKTVLVSQRFLFTLTINYLALSRDGFGREVVAGTAVVVMVEFRGAYGNKDEFVVVAIFVAVLGGRISACLRGFDLFPFPPWIRDMGDGT